mmetsp:Transcript_11760/g.36541  ORF Transcript_11760/g.36541 Transcript_11760/m.36541 type:complete len:236 (+) Transcript_11760:599-1306(+)
MCGDGGCCAAPKTARCAAEVVGDGCADPGALEGFDASRSAMGPSATRRGFTPPLALVAPPRACCCDCCCCCCRCACGCCDSCGFASDATAACACSRHCCRFVFVLGSSATFTTRWCKSPSKKDRSHSASAFVASSVRSNVTYPICHGSGSFFAARHVSRASSMPVNSPYFAKAARTSFSVAVRGMKRTKRRFGGAGTNDGSLSAYVATIGAPWGPGCPFVASSAALAASLLSKFT